MPIEVTLEILNWGKDMRGNVLPFDLIRQCLDFWRFRQGQRAWNQRFFGLSQEKNGFKLFKPMSHFAVQNRSLSHL